MNDVLERVVAGENLSQAETASVMDSIMRGEWAEEPLGRLLLAMRAKGETVEELAGAAQAMRQHMTPIPTTRVGVLDTCGPGGVGSGVFNISTTTAIVAAAAGVPVAKHGNRSVTSKSGSADALAALGVNIEADVPTVARCLDEVGLCFCFAPLLHTAMKHVMPVRRKLGVATIFNLLGPLCNPARAARQLLGVGRAELQEKLSAALALLGTPAVVVHGEDGLGEVTLATTTRVIDRRGAERRDLVWQPSDFGLARAPLDAVKVDGPAASAALIRGVLRGEPGPARDLVVMNAAAALWTAGRSESLTECVAQVTAAIDTGAAQRVLDKLVQVSHGHAVQ